MPNTLRTVIALGIAGAVAGCANLSIKGMANSNLYAEMPRSGTFAIRLVSGEPVVGDKIERMLRYKLERLDYHFTEASPDFLVSLAYDTVPAGSASSAFTSLYTVPKTTSTTAATVVKSTGLYTKTIAVQITRASTGEKLWSGVVSERDGAIKSS